MAVTLPFDEHVESLGSAAPSSLGLGDWPPQPARAIAQASAADEVTDGGHPTRLATYARLLSAAGRQVRAAVRAACEDALEGTRVHLMAFRSIAGETRRLGRALLEALGGDL